MPPSVSVVVLPALIVSNRFRVFSSVGVRFFARLWGPNTMCPPVGTMHVNQHSYWRIFITNISPGCFFLRVSLFKATYMNSPCIDKASKKNMASPNLFAKDSKTESRDDLSSSCRESRESYSSVSSCRRTRDWTRQMCCSDACLLLQVYSAVKMRN